MKIKCQPFATAVVVLAAFDFAYGETGSRIVQKDDTAAVFEIQLAGDEAWTATTDVPSADGGWINLRRKQGTDCSRPATYKILHNYSTDVRVGHIYVNGLTYTVTQLGYGATLSPSGNVSIPAAGTIAEGQISFSIEPATDGAREIAWTATSDSDWVAVRPSRGDGDSTVYYSVAENTSESERIATLTIAGQQILLTQSGAEVVDPDANKVWLVPETAITWPCPAKEFDVSLVTGNDVNWTAASDAEWIVITNSKTGTGSSVMHVSLPENSSVLSRSGKITVNNAELTVIQRGTTDFELALNPQGTSFSYGGAISNVSVAASQDMSWTAKSSMPWVRITSGSSGAGSGNVRYVVNANPTLQERTAEIEVEAWVPYPEIDIARGLTQWKDENWIKWTAFNDPSVRDADVQGCTEGVWFRVTETNALNRLFDLNNGAASLYVQEFQNRLVYDAPDGNIVDLGFSVATNVTYDLFLVTTPTTTAIYGGIHDSGVYRHLYTDNRSLRITNYKHTTKPSEDWLVKGEASTQAYYFWNRPLTATELLNFPSEAPRIPAVSGDVYSTLYSHTPMDRFRVRKASGEEDVLFASNVIVTAGRNGLSNRALSGDLVFPFREFRVRIPWKVHPEGSSVFGNYHYGTITANVLDIADAMRVFCNGKRNQYSDPVIFGSAMIYMSNAPNIETTYLCWLKVNEVLSEPIDIMSFLRFQDVNSSDGYYFFDENIDHFKIRLSHNGFNVVESSTSGDAVTSASYGGERLKKGKWQFFAIASNGSKMTLYLDGEDIGTVGLRGYRCYCLDSWCAYGNGGKIVFDDIKTFTSCLTTDQINEIYNLEKPLQRKLTITQGVATATLSETSLECPSRGDMQTISLTLPVRNIQWTADPLVDWIAAEPASGIGSTNITLTIGKNYETSDRTGVIIIAGVPVTIHQRRAGVTVPYAPIIASFGGETLFVPIGVDDEDTHWIVEDYPDDWMYAIDEDGVGSTDMELDVDEMGQGVSLTSRIGAVTISGEKFYVVQRDFIPTISPRSVSARYNTSGGAIQVNTEDGIEYWESASDADWITIAGTGNGVGNGTLTYTLSENQTDKVRIGRIIIAGEVCTITQACPPVVTGLLIVGSDSVLAGETTNYVARLLYSDGSFVNTNDVSWSISQGSVATIGANGLLTAGASESVVTVSTSCMVEGRELAAEKEVSILAKPTSLAISVGQELFCPGWTAQVDFFAAYVDGVTNAISPNVSIVGDATIDGDGFLTIGNTVGTVTINATYEENGVIVQAAKRLSVRAPITINEALGSSLLSYSGGGNSAWQVDPWRSHDDAFSMKSGQIQAGQTSDITTVVDGVGTISFWIRTSCSNGSAFRFVVDGDAVIELSGVTDWTNIVHAITTYDEHELVWSYAKGAAAEHTNEDAVWIDAVVWAAGPPDPIPAIKTDAEVAEALGGSADANLAVNLTSKDEYTAYRAWVDRHGLDHQTVKDAPKSWLSYALDTSVLIDKQFRNGDLSIDMFAPYAAGGFLLELGLNGVEIGDEATAANLAKVFGVEGATSLDRNDFSSDNVTFSFGTPNDGKATIVAEPKDGNAESFFLRATMRDFYDDVPVVSFSLNGGGSLNGASDEILVDRDAEYGSLPTPTRTGHTFDGWYTKATGGTKVTGSTTITTNSSHVLYAHWTPNTYTITFDPNGGSCEIVSQTVTYGSAYGVLPTPTRVGNIFQGWFTSPTGGNKILSDETFTALTNITVYAQWNVATCTVIFNANVDRGIVSPKTKVVPYGSPYGELPIPTRADFYANDYAFIGWYTDDGFAVDEHTIETNQVNEVLYARWHECHYVLQDDGAILTWCVGESGDVFIPAKVDGYAVVGIVDAFSGDSSLTSIAMPDTITTIGPYAFCNCRNLTNINISASVTSIGSDAFLGCTNLTSVLIPACVTNIGYSAFEDCSSLSGLVIPDGIADIGDRVFLRCRNLTAVDIPNSVTNIGSYAFCACDRLMSVTMPNGLMCIGDRAFCSCGELTGALAVPDSVTSIGELAFYGCTNLDSVTIGNGVTNIGHNAFGGCSGLTSVTISNCVANIGQYAFAGCSGLTSVMISNCVANIGYSAFNGCLGLSSVIIGSGVTNIDDSAFYGCSRLANMTIPDSVTSIGNNAFSGCSGLTRVSIPDSVTRIGSSSFSGCSGLTSVTIPDSVKSIGPFAFKDCSNLTHAYVPSALRSSMSSYYGVFEGCPADLVITYY